jgi:hypothetical protein
MYTIQYIVYSKHQHHKFWREAPGQRVSPGSGEAWSPWAFPQQQHAPGWLDAPAAV